jgi:lipoprotein-releasing system permease protein
MRLPIRLAWRYAWTRRNRSLTHLISGISMFVIAAVTAAMIAILSAFNGIESVVTELFGTLDAPLALIPTEGAALPDSAGQWLEARFGPDGDDPLLEVVAPVIEDEAVVAWGDASPHVVTVLGFSPEMLEAAPIESALRSEHWVPEFTDGAACTALGLGVRNLLGVGSLDPEKGLPFLQFRAPIRGKKLTRHKERAFHTEQAFACDVFSVNAEIDRKYALVPLGFARDLFQRPEAVSRFELAPAGALDERLVAQQIQSALDGAGHPWRVRTRAEKNALITQTNRAEKWATFVILSFILVVAAFNVMASLTMLLLEKRQDIEVLNAMGLTGWRLEQVFAWQGVLINAIGGVVGAAVGLLLVIGQQQFGWVKLQGSVIPAYPVEWMATDVLGTLGVVVLIGGIGSGWMVRNLVRRFAAV